MEAQTKEKARLILTDYLETNHHRKTFERYAVLDAIYNLRSPFTVDELNTHLQENNLRVSRATLYNTLKLLMSLKLVVQHRLPGSTMYAASLANNSQCHQVCTSCGKLSEIRLAEVSEDINSIRLRRFHIDGFSLYIYGTCSKCHAKKRQYNKTVKSDTMNKKTKKYEEQR